MSADDKKDLELNLLKDANHPIICLLTLMFKSLAVVSFLVLPLLGLNESYSFLLVVILNSIDFWYIKNVSGRVLVGLRWWNEVREDGIEVWIYESSNESIYTINYC